MMNRRVQLLFFAIGLVFFVFIIHHAGARVILRDLGRTGWMFVPIVLVWGMVYVTNTIAWRVILGTEGAMLPFWRAYSISVASFAINYVTPMVSLGGEPFKAAAAAPWVGPARATASVVTFRIVHTLGQLVFWLLALPVAYHELPHGTGTLVLLTMTGVVLVGATALLVLLLQARVLERMLNALPRIPVLRRMAAPVERRRATLTVVDDEMAAFVRDHPRRFVAALVAEVAGRFVAMLEFFLIGRSVGVELSYAAAVVIGGFSQLVLNLLFFVPFELGSKEGGLYLIVRLLGFPASLGVYAAIVSRLRELAWIVIGLLLIWVSGVGAGGRGARRTRWPGAGGEAETSTAP